jgi:hypothetical protein
MVKTPWMKKEALSTSGEVIIHQDRQWHWLIVWLAVMGNQENETQRAIYSIYDRLLFRRVLRRRRDLDFWHLRWLRLLHVHGMALYCA